MSRDRRACASWLAALAIGALGCASTPAPRHWLPSVRGAGSNGYGGWIVVAKKNAPRKEALEGELIAIDAEAFHILTSERLVTLRIADVDHATVACYQPGEVALWAGLGALSAQTHGLFGIISLPVWGTTGAVAAHAENQAALAKHPPNTVDELRRFARFPQGLPPGLDAATLATKPLPTR